MQAGKQKLGRAQAKLQAMADACNSHSQSWLSWTFNCNDFFGSVVVFGLEYLSNCILEGPGSQMVRLIARLLMLNIVIWFPFEDAQACSQEKFQLISNTDTSCRRSAEVFTGEQETLHDRQSMGSVLQQASRPMLRMVCSTVSDLQLAGSTTYRLRRATRTLSVMILVLS